MRNTLGVISVVLVLCVVAGLFMGCGDGEMSQEEVVNKFHSIGYDEDGRELPDGKVVPWKKVGEKWWGREGMKMPGSFEETEPDDVDKEKLFPWQKDGEQIWGRVPKTEKKIDEEDYQEFYYWSNPSKVIMPKWKFPDMWDSRVKPVKPIILNETDEIIEVDGQLFSIWEDELGKIRKVYPASEDAKKQE